MNKNEISLLSIASSDKSFWRHLKTFFLTRPQPSEPPLL